jgi:hypothetical protein
MAPSDRLLALTFRGRAPASREIEHFITAEGAKEKPCSDSSRPLEVAAFQSLELAFTDHIWEELGQHKARDRRKTVVSSRFSVPSLRADPIVKHQFLLWCAADCPCEVSCHLLSSWLHIGQHNLSALAKES